MKRIEFTGLLVIVILGAFVAHAARFDGEGEITVPQGRAVLIDGVIESEEWADAVLITIDSQADLYLKHADGFLLLGLVTQKPIVGNVLVQTGSEVRILHSSAALGTAVYHEDSDLWIRTKDFVWRCRSRMLTESALAQRDVFLQEEGWLASITYMGEYNHLEYQIADSDTIAKLALVLLTAAQPSDFLVWPQDMIQDIFPGPIPAVGQLHPKHWPQLTMIPEPQR